MILTKPARPLGILWSNLRLSYFYKFHKDYNSISKLIESRATFSKDQLGKCQCLHCLRALLMAGENTSKKSSPGAQAWKHAILFLIAFNQWGFILWTASFNLRKKQDQFTFSMSDGFSQVEPSSLLRVPQLFAQVLFFCVSRGACLATFNVAIGGTLHVDRIKLMAYLFAGADPIQGMTRSIFKEITRRLRKKSQGPSPLYTLVTDFWILLLSISALGASFGDVSISANRCDSITCLLTVWELCWLVVSVLCAICVFGCCQTPVDILARFAFSEATGTAAGGFGFKEVMDFYSTHLEMVGDTNNGMDGEGRKEGVAHFKMFAVSEGRLGWLTPDSFLVSRTFTGESVRGNPGALEGSDSVEEKPAVDDLQLVDASSTSLIPASIRNSDEPVEGRSPMPILSTSNPLLSNSKALPKEQNDMFITKCPKTIDTGLSIFTCLETNCPAPETHVINGTPYTIITCRTKAHIYKRCVNGRSKNFRYCMNRRFAVRHNFLEFGWTPGPVEALLADIDIFVPLVFDAKFRNYLTKAYYDPTIHNKMFRKCGCCTCQLIYAKKRVSQARHIVSRVLLMCGCFYLLFAAGAIVFTALQMRSSNDFTSATALGSQGESLIRINKIFFQALLFILTRGASFAVVNINLTKFVSKNRIMAYLLAAADPVTCVLGKMIHALLTKPREHKTQVLALFTDFWLLSTLSASFLAAYADVTISAALCTYDLCQVTQVQIILLAIGVGIALMTAVTYLNPIEILGRHAFSEARGTCGGFELGDVVAEYKMQLKEVVSKEGCCLRLGIVEAKEGVDGMVLLDPIRAKRKTAVAKSCQV
ncbi:hypothetical protein HDV05_004439 [Chytridiales sp. JEL 0842]|nr:hypothetical protein HDV05_004439 [Chytridiales sp. JEL 0842]